MCVSGPVLCICGQERSFHQHCSEEGVKIQLCVDLNINDEQRHQWPRQHKQRRVEQHCKHLEPNPLRERPAITAHTQVQCQTQCMC